MDYLNLHTHQFTDRHDILEIVNQYPHEFDAVIPHYSIGIHPWYIVESRLEEDFKILESKLELENCLAVGECGLDKRIETPFQLQTVVFEKQLHLAEQYQKPVILHCVAAFQEVIETKKRLQISVPMVIHGFSKNSETAKQLLDNGFYISFGKYLLRNSELETVFTSVPNDRFFLETDTVEESIREVYGLAAKYKNMEIELLKQTVRSNFNQVFKSKINL
ncbi:TatD family hydrolase [Flavobacterium sp. CYK-4]|uniref:TatD family hydrolase n=1 Tax=Flavobacterium lotistagni TaxID=2709660 RepID=UPI001407718D|nr:TatD family hydrolase [Flavobacterium lotistagni]NHM07398.1 TatD family hydrolase [Flavobacterium lotistagni]